MIGRMRLKERPARMLREIMLSGQEWPKKALSERGGGEEEDEYLISLQDKGTNNISGQRG